MIEAARNTILIINPNSTRRVTDEIDQAVDVLRGSGGPTIECATLAEGPPAIESAEHVASVVEPMCRLMEVREAHTVAFVIACYSDPGIDAARARVRRPVLGIAESAMRAACTGARRFGVISILPEAVERHAAYARRLGLESSMAADLPVGLGVLELADEALAFRRLCEVGAELRDRYAAQVVIPGCTGMARYRARLEADLGVPVIDPTQAAVVAAIALVHGGAGQARSN